MAKINRRKGILVYASWIGLNGPTLLGTLYPNIVMGNEIFSFEYSRDWLESKFANKKSSMLISKEVLVNNICK